MKASIEGGLCRDCRYWNPGLRADALGLCSLAASDDSEPLHTWTKGYALDDAGVSASFVTAPDFGCTQWWPR